MPKLALLNQAGDKVKDITLNESVFGIEPNQQVLYDVIKAQRAAMRQGTQKAKTRAEVRGGGRKPWRQKGTGRARQGSTRSPQWVGGGVVFAPQPRDYDVKVNKKVRQLALKSAYSAKVSDEEIRVLDKLELAEIKTKVFQDVLTNINTTGRTLVILSEANDTVELSGRNIPGVEINTWDHVSVYDILRAHNVVITFDAVKKVEEVLG
ncbi:50S ribosomal protein L4 [Mycoplasmatota bacterium zrk1]